MKTMQEERPARVGKGSSVLCDCSFVTRTVVCACLPPCRSHTAPQALRRGHGECTGDRNHHQRELSPFCDVPTPFRGDQGRRWGARGGQAPWLALLLAATFPAGILQHRDRPVLEALCQPALAWRRTAAPFQCVTLMHLQMFSPKPRVPAAPRPHSPGPERCQGKD